MYKNTAIEFILFILCLVITIGSIIYNFVYIIAPDILFAESEIVNTYTLTSRDKQLTIAERTYNLDEDISNTPVTETVYLYTLKDTTAKDKDDIYMSKIQYVSVDGNKKESFSVIKNKDDVKSEKIKSNIIINAIVMIASMVATTLSFLSYRTSYRLNCYLYD